MDGRHAERIELARQFADAARARFPDNVVDVRLFGSVARGEDGPDSDVDVFVLWAGTREEGRKRLVGLACDLLLDLGEYVSVKVMTPEEWATALRHHNRFAEAVLADSRALA